MQSPTAGSRNSLLKRFVSLARVRPRARLPPSGGPFARGHGLFRSPSRRCRRSLVWLALLACATSGCVYASMEHLQRRAAFELRCPPQQLSFTTFSEGIWSGSYGVEGCGRRAVYIYDAKSQNWLLSSIESPPPVPPGPAYTPLGTARPSPALSGGGQ